MVLSLTIFILVVYIHNVERLAPLQSFALMLLFIREKHSNYSNHLIHKSDFKNIVKRLRLQAGIAELGRFSCDGCIYLFYLKGLKHFPRELIKPSNLYGPPVQVSGPTEADNGGIGQGLILLIN
ncbi:hypothetical protein [Micavibrio aeruginosavorus]|uniref:hypothetical protein n=1 Tax=Micavibrio aeruginosavorus TaxID=349221 RepID=UPI0005A1497E|nr:hypothetical protein [Micavibrio aeruginosavorus]